VAAAAAASEREFGDDAATGRSRVRPSGGGRINVSSLELNMEFAWRKPNGNRMHISCWHFSWEADTVDKMTVFAA
jgi:hypothetical protein